MSCSPKNQPLKTKKRPPEATFLGLQPVRLQCIQRSSAIPPTGGVGAPVNRSIQAMVTAMKASRKIKTPPTIGKTKGIMGVLASTGSTGFALSWCSGFDMGFLMGLSSISDEFYPCTPNLRRFLNTTRPHCVKWVCKVSLLSPIFSPSHASSCSLRWCWRKPRLLV